MGIYNFAALRTYAAITASGSAGAVTAKNGEPVKVCGFIVLNTTADTIWTVYDGSDNVLFTFQHATAKTSHEYTTPWMADTGIKIGNDKGTGAATIFHSNSGT